VNNGAIHLSYANSIVVPCFAALYNTPAGGVAGLVLVDTVLDRTKDDGGSPGNGWGNVSISLAKYAFGHIQGGVRVKRPNQLYCRAVRVAHVVSKPLCQVSRCAETPD